MEEKVVALYPADHEYHIERCETDGRERRSRKRDHTIKVSGNNNQNHQENNGLLSWSDVEKAELRIHEGVPTSLRCEDGVYRRLHQHSPPPEDDTYTPHYSSHIEDLDPTARKYPRNASLRFFVFSAAAAFVLLMMYVPAYKQVTNRPGSLAGWSYNTSRDTRMYILPDNVTVLNQPKDVCRSKKQHDATKSSPYHTRSNEPEIFLLVIICSSMAHSDKRSAIRDTWGNQTNYELLARQFHNLTAKFAHVNMTESLFHELGYSSENVSSMGRRFRREVHSEDEYSAGDVDYVPTLEDDGQMTNFSIKLKSDTNESHDALLNGENVLSYIKNSNENGAFSDKSNNALFESLTDDISSYNLDRFNPLKGKHISNNQLDRMFLNDIKTDATADTRIIDGPFRSFRFVHYRRKRESLDEALVDNKFVKKNSQVDDGVNDDPRFDNGEKRAMYEDGENNNNLNDNILGNFESTDFEEQADPLKDYEYQSEESNIMKIPKKGEKLSDYEDTNSIVKSALDNIKNTISLSVKGDNLNLKYFMDDKKNGEIETNDVNVPSKEASVSKHKDDATKSDSLYLHPNVADVSEHASNKDSGGSSAGEEKRSKPMNFVKTKYLFLLGQSGNENDTDLQLKVDEEAALYGDIIQEGFIDSYNNLTLKSVMMLKWIISNCGDNVHYIMKTDDDTYVNIPRLIEALQNKSIEHLNKTAPALLKSANAPSDKERLAASDVTSLQDHNVNQLTRQTFSNEKLLMGDLICDARPISDTTSKWYSPSYMYSGKVYPRYLSGSGYVMSMGAARALYHDSLDTPLFHLEDIYITGMCAYKAGIKPQDNPGFSYVTRKFKLCVFLHLITAHRVTPSQMRQMHQMLSSPATHNLEACEARRLLSLSNKSYDILSSAKNVLSKTFLGSPRNIIAGLAGFGFADTKKKKLIRAKNGCS